MGRKFYITESQFNLLMEQQALCEGIFSNCKSPEELKNKILKVVAAGAVAVSVIFSALSNISTLTPEQKEEIKKEVAKVASDEDWKCVAEDVIVTVYNAVPQQCNNDVKHTASQFELDLSDVQSHKIIAMERTFMAELGLHYGDIVKIVGTYNGKQDGIFQIQDTMNKRFKGMHKVDVLEPNNIKYGGTLKNSPAKIFVLNDRSDRTFYMSNMAPSLNNIEQKQNAYFASLEQI